MNEHEEVKEYPRMSRPLAWSILLGTLAFLWIFGMYLGPWIIDHTPVYKDIVQVIIRDDIDSGAYFYTEIKGAYEGERYLRQKLSHDIPNRWGLTWPFILGIVLCLVILTVGFNLILPPGSGLEQKKTSEGT